MLRSLSFYAAIPSDIPYSNISQLSPQSHKICPQKKMCLTFQFTRLKHAFPSHHFIGYSESLFREFSLLKKIFNCIPGV